ncbi:MAG TPA: hypothetical protein VFV17_09805, partial [Usitatibacteraceae bacterium]|nr:hypothetical protein [Usitatibacteraceae bacterium]
EADLRWNRVPKAPDPAPAPEPPRSETPQAAEPAQSAIDELEMLSAPAIPAEAPAMLVVDATPASDLDLPLDDRSAEDRVRRIEYMHGRFPELKSQTISIEDPDSVINAARLYFEEQQHDRACELLTFGVEERPQEVRYWLAQFEIFRLENMAAEFTELAGKFHVLFAYTPYWPKVCHIGRELDPGNPLFSAGRDVLAEDGQFDPVAENWLNAPMDFTADALMSDLRRELFDDHNVDRADFASLSQRLSEVRAQ